MASVKKHSPTFVLLRFLLVVSVCLILVLGGTFYWSQKQLESLGIKNIQLQLGNPLSGEAFFRSIHGLYEGYDQGSVTQTAKFSLENIDLTLFFNRDNQSLDFKIRCQNADIHLELLPVASESDLLDYLIEPIQNYLINLPLYSVNLEKFNLNLHDPSLSFPLQGMKGNATLQEGQLNSSGQILFNEEHALSYQIKTYSLAGVQISLTNELPDKLFQLDADMSVEDNSTIKMAFDSHPEVIREYLQLFQLNDFPWFHNLKTLEGALSITGEINLPSEFKGTLNQWKYLPTLKAEASTKVAFSYHDLPLKQGDMDLVQTLMLSNGLINTTFQPQSRLKLSAELPNATHDDIFLLESLESTDAGNKPVEVTVSLDNPFNVSLDPQDTINIQYQEPFKVLTHSPSANRTIQLTFTNGQWQHSQELLGNTEFEMKLKRFKELPIDFLAGDVRVSQTDEQYTVNSSVGLKNQPEIATINAIYDTTHHHLNVVSNLTVQQIPSDSAFQDIIHFYAPGIAADQHSNLKLDFEYTLDQLNTDSPKSIWKAEGSAQIPWLSYEDYHQQNMDLVFSGTGNLNQFGSQFTLLSDSIFVGVPINHFQAEAEMLGNLQQGTFEAPIKNLQFSVFKGAVFLKEQTTLYYDTVDPNQQEYPELKNALLQMQAQKLDLSAILETLQNQEIKGTGQLSGTIPIQIDSSGNIQVTDGNLSSIEPGGMIQYQDKKYATMGETNSNLKLLFDSLDNFHYNELKALISYQHNGQTDIHLNLNGRNPDASKGFPLDLNVNLELNLLKHLESLRLASEEFSQEVGGKIQDKQRR